MCRLIDRTASVFYTGEFRYFYCYRPDSITAESFSEKRMDLLEARAVVVNLIQKSYPELRRKARSYELDGIIYVAGLLSARDVKEKYLPLHAGLMKRLSDDLFSILLSPIWRLN